MHRVAAAMPHTRNVAGPSGNAVYQVGGKSFVFFRNPRPDAIDPQTGQRYDDVVVFWVEDEDEKTALLQQGAPFFTTPHFDGHPSVLVRAADLGQLTLTALTELVQGAWLARASPTRARVWLASSPG